jgi:hypothetical protein
LFEDLISIRKDATFESSINFGGNGINIAEFAPKEVILADPKNKRVGRLKR